MSRARAATEAQAGAEVGLRLLQAPALLLVARHDAFEVGIDASCVAQVEERADSRPLDLAQLLQFTPTDATDHARQYWVVQRGPSVFRIRMGGRAVLQSTAELQIWALPALLAPLARRAAVSGLWLADARLGLLLDAERLTALAAAAAAEVTP